MAVKTYTEAELKTLVKDRFDRLKNLPPDFAITDDDMNSAFDWATAQLGFDTPSGSDPARSEKYQWLINRMTSDLYCKLIESYRPIVDNKDIKTREIFDSFVKSKEALDEKFEKGFTDADSMPLVRGSGTVIDVHGQDRSYEGLEPIDREDGTIEGIDN